MWLENVGCSEWLVVRHSGWFLAHCYVVARVFKWLLGGGLLT